MTTKIVKLQPTPGYVLVFPKESEKKTASGIVLPDSHEEKPQKGEVLAVGADQVSESGVKISAPCKKGDVIVYKEWGGNEYKEGDEEYLFIKFEDILAVVGK
ncbi:MAG: co-chaperone GroES [Candidatus Shapirobacteria bacterium]|nr:co-chaperone GroES [Candidatus Shapirobacteria bacterium]MDD5073658.1 co-chaperone GroES [Candidatus Shapirobacteria bacterium]MDD5481381.1 co-chaperone GroES [Candidatus Shapirobacteria bacterium]